MRWRTVIPRWDPMWLGRYWSTRRTWTSYRISVTVFPVSFEKLQNILRSLWIPWCQSRQVVMLAFRTTTNFWCLSTICWRLRWYLTPPGIIFLTRVKFWNPTRSKLIADRFAKTGREAIFNKTLVTWKIRYSTSSSYKVCTRWFQFHTPVGISVNYRTCQTIIQLGNVKFSRSALKRHLLRNVLESTWNWRGMGSNKDKRSGKLLTVEAHITSYIVPRSQFWWFEERLMSLTALIRGWIFVNTLRHFWHPADHFNITMLQNFFPLVSVFKGQNWITPEYFWITGCQDLLINVSITYCCSSFKRERTI